MNKARKGIVTFLASQGPSGITLPYTFNPTSGAFPSPWVAPNWSGKENTPTLGAELLTDPGLEAAYTDGKCATLAAWAGTPTVAESADAHGGTKAQQFTGTAANDGARFGLFTATQQAWYEFSAWAKRTAGTNNKVELTVIQTSGTPSASSRSPALNSATYAQVKIIKRSANANQLQLYPLFQYTTGYDTVIVDDCSLKAITASTLFGLVDCGVAAHVSKAQWTWNKNSIAGVVARADANTNPQNFLIAYYWTQSNSFTYCVLDQCLNGVYSNKIATWSNQATAGAGGTPTAAQWLEIRVTGNTAQLFHNNIQVGTDQAIDASLANNTYVGVFSSGGGSQLESFFVQENS